MEIVASSAPEAIEEAVATRPAGRCDAATRRGGREARGLRLRLFAGAAIVAVAPVLLAWAIARDDAPLTAPGGAPLAFANRDMALLGGAGLYVVFIVLAFLTWPWVARARRQRALLARLLHERSAWRIRTRRRIVDERRRKVERVAAEYSHDINNVFGSILSAADAADEISAEPALQEVTGSIVAAVEEGMVVSQRLLAFDEMLPLQPMSGDVNATVAEAVRRLPRSEGEVQVRLAGRPLVAVLDHDRLLVCILELLRSAREPSGPGTPVTVQTRLMAAGHGDDPQRLRVAIDVVVGGNGMGEPQALGHGLTLVQQFAGRTGGTLELHSRPGEGTRAVLVLPIATEPSASPPDPEPARIPGQPRVLVVDDSAALRAGIARRLRAAGMSVSEAADSVEALAVGQRGVDAVVTDVVLPGGMDGFALGRHLRAADPDLALVFVSGFISARQPEVLANDELANFLRKPIDFDNLIAVLLGLLAVRDARAARLARVSST